MLIAITSQNRKTITGHAGRCRKFWIYEIDGGEIRTKRLLELPTEETFHQSPANRPHPLDDMSVLITGGMGIGLRNRLRRKGILAVATAEPDPDQAVTAWLNGTLVEMAPENHPPHSQSNRH